MPILAGLIDIAIGLALMAFGLFVFYAFLPVAYALFGGLLGYRIGLLLVNKPIGDIGVIAIIGAVVGAVAFFIGSRWMEPYRRVLMGGLAGALLGMALADVLGFGNGILAVALLFGGAVLGGIVGDRYFDYWWILASAFGGAWLLMHGLHLIFPSWSWLVPSTTNLVGLLVWVVLGALGAAWQWSNIKKWVKGPAAV
jgi:hypothetical protein